ncbi:regulator of telomere elongation helicase 1 homolog isoform X2 [Limulus polyphemus]|uniref:Regulator of telomere elongation helicase 1 homolog n=1 Tax=Limulus polyphemus TaxID=6850 RepID=A0ABM1SZU1_LIMPO|nr:regulator of telomere elongation helicase 1 homolog isoform X2 [Limulus polyphemus]
MQAANGILESPTGTGKTLSLLCSSLAWLENHKALQQAMVLQGSVTDSQKNFTSQLWDQLELAVGERKQQTTIFSVPRIIYSSRTHTQLSQAVQELKKTNYKHMRAVVLGSRDQLCLHPEVSKLQNNAAKLHACRAKVNTRACPFYLNVEQKILGEKDYQTNSVIDIEDLVKLGKKHTCCPYYAARSLKSKTDIIFTPYNYLIDPKSRKAHGIELQGNVLIFDEAHNIESVCEESMSFQLKSADIALCISEVSQVIDKMKDINNLDFSQDSGAPDFTLADLSILKVMFCELEEELDSIVATEGVAGCTKPGDFMLEVLAKVDLTAQKKDIVLDLLDKVILFLTVNNTSPWMTKGAGLQKFSDMLRILFSKASLGATSNNIIKKEFSRMYKIFLQQETLKTQQKQIDVWTVATKTNKKQGWILNCWCFSPGLGMQDIVDQGIHSMILTSGTLSPLNSFAAELGQPFPIQLENPHIINDDQVYIGVVSQGPDGTPLNSSFRNRSDKKYLQSLGRTILNFSRIIPDGLLVFFPSYSVLKQCNEHWEESGLWQSMCAVKPIFIEPQGKDAFQESIEQFYNKIYAPESRGASFFAVCRGKVSEGLDFSDRNARAVIITGLPFPPFLDPRVKLKMSYLDQGPKNKGLSGNEWYMQQASRAVNQAVGRVIRHRKDYGAVLLCDNRFAEKRINSQLSLWVRDRVKSYTTFGPALRDLSKFFKNMDITGLHKTQVGISKESSDNCVQPVNNVVDSSFNPIQDIARNKFSQSIARNETKSHEDENPFQGYLLPLKPNDQVHQTTGKRKSVFDALEECDAKNFKDTQSVISFSSLDTGVKNTNQLSASESKDTKKNCKRRKINMQLQGIDGEPNCKPHTSVGANPLKVENSREIWKKHLIKIKLLLGKTPDYAKFCSAIKEYKSVRDVKQFASVMKQVFSNVAEGKKFIEITSQIVSANERIEFLKLCESKMEKALLIENEESHRSEADISEGSNVSTPYSQPDKVSSQPPRALSFFSGLEHTCCWCKGKARVPVRTSCGNVYCCLCLKQLAKDKSNCVLCQKLLKKHKSDRLYFSSAPISKKVELHS